MRQGQLCELHCIPYPHAPVLQAMTVCVCVVRRGMHSLPHFHIPQYAPVSWRTMSAAGRFSKLGAEEHAEVTSPRGRPSAVAS